MQLKGPFDHDTAVLITRQCLSALVYLHKIPIAHRDIKPANLLVDKRNGNLHVKLTDFGTSREAQTLTTFCGTESYMAPELLEIRQSRAKTKQTYSLAVDIWSLGVMAYECLEYCLDGLPNADADGYDRCEALEMEISEAEDAEDTDTLTSVLASHMVVMDPEARGSAQVCYDAIRALPASNRPANRPRERQRQPGRLPSNSSGNTSSSGTQSSARPTAYGQGYEDTIRPSIENDGGSTVKAPRAQTRTPVPSLGRQMSSPSAPSTPKRSRISYMPTTNSKSRGT